MNPILIILILAGAVLAWFILAPVFNMVGGFVSDLIRQAGNAINDEDLDKMN